MAKILIVDDSGLSRRTLRKILEPAGHEVVEATEGIAAIEQYFLDRPDLVLLDLNMVGMYGIDVLNRLRELDPRARIIIASADIQDSTREMAQSGGASAFITKPFKSEQVLAAVSQALRGEQGWN